MKVYGSIVILTCTAALFASSIAQLAFSCFTFWYSRTVGCFLPPPIPPAPLGEPGIPVPLVEHDGPGGVDFGDGGQVDVGDEGVWEEADLANAQRRGRQIVPGTD